MFPLILTCIYFIILFWFTIQWNRFRACKEIKFTELAQVILSFFKAQIAANSKRLYAKFATKKNGKRTSQNVKVISLQALTEIHKNNYISTQNNTKTNPSPLVTLLIPVRNEVSNLPSLFKSLYAQTYDKNKLEILIIDDHSTDSTAGFVTGRKNFLSGLTYINLFELSENTEDKTIVTGKKSALEYGISQAKGEWILLTDADCKMGNDWVSIMVNTMKAGELNFLAGPVIGEKKSHKYLTFLHEIIQLEFLGLVGMGASGLRGGFPLMCNAANLGFKKSAFYECGGFGKSQNYASGDDEFLLANMFKFDSSRVGFLKDKSAIVTTNLPDTFSGFIAQRIRWASKALAGKSFLSLLFVMFIFILNVWIGWQGWEIYTGNTNLSLFFVQILIKLFAEFVFLYPILKWFGCLRLILWLIPLQFIYPFYIIVVGLLSRLPVYKWKGRWVR